MAEQNSPIDVYYDMDIAQICQNFNKSRNTVDKAVAKLVKNYPDKGWKFKNPETKRITIKAEGVEKLSTYFRKEKQEISTVETELRMEIDKLNALLQEKDKTIANLEILYNERLKLELDKSQQTFLLEQKTKDEKITELDTKINEKTHQLDEQNSKITEQSDQILKQSEEISSLKTENQMLQDEKQEVNTQKEDLESQLSEYRKKEEEYNSKSFFYRLTHKFSLS